MSVCVICGSPLPPRRTRYCSEACARIGENRLAREVTSQRQRPKPYHLITCPDCGLEVRVHIKAKRCPSCQAEADRRHNAECKARKRAGKARPIGSEALCERCHRPYVVRGGLQRYCPDCAPTATAENRNALSRAWNRAAYADPERRAARNESRTRPKPPEAVCPICHKSFQPASTRQKYCSPPCRIEAAKAANARYHQDNKTAVASRKRRVYRAHLAAMTPEERAAFYAKRNAAAREAYHRRASTSRKEPTHEPR